MPLGFDKHEEKHTGIFVDVFLFDFSGCPHLVMITGVVIAKTVADFWS